MPVFGYGSYCHIESSEADHSTPFSAKIKKGGAIPPLPHVFIV
jgi:hypothetical protein